MLRMAVLAAGLWLGLGCLWGARHAQARADGTLSARPIVLELAAGPLTCQTFRGLAADLAVMLAPRAVHQRARAVVICRTDTHGILQVLDRHGVVLCTQTGRGVDAEIAWDGAACGW